MTLMAGLKSVFITTPNNQSHFIPVAETQNRRQLFSDLMIIVQCCNVGFGAREYEPSGVLQKTRSNTFRRDIKYSVVPGRVGQPPRSSRQYLRICCLRLGPIAPG